LYLFVVRSRGFSVVLLAAALALQGLAAGVPHDHGPACADGPAVEPAAGPSAPHDCLACSIHAPAAAVAAGVAVLRCETGVVPVVALAPFHGFSAPVESSGPRGPPRVI
jgi:hypothetical protein